MKITTLGGLKDRSLPLYLVEVNHPFLRFSMKFHGNQSTLLHLAMSKTAYSALMLYACMRSAVFPPEMLRT